MEIEDLVTRLAKWDKGKRAPPQRVLVYPTNRCNLKCPFCFQRLSPYDYKGEMPKERWLEIVQSAREMGVKVFSILGGEPFYRTNDIIDVMKVVKENGLAGSIVTNGSLFNNEVIKTIVEIEWDLIRFSIDGSREVHDKLRGVEGVYDKAINVMKKFKKLKKRTKKE